jgi:hypothetical protein|tara:strand:+ start:163 stop:819 length:657 start_codon:yes stop_codon:yes gene_type:complete
LNYLSQRPFGGKCYEASPKFLENTKTWKNIGYGVQGIIPETGLYHSEEIRRSPLSIAPTFPKQNDRRGSMKLNIANGFRRKQKGFDDGGGGRGEGIGSIHSLLSSNRRTMFEHQNGLMPLQTRIALKDKSESRVERYAVKRSKEMENLEKNRVMNKAQQQFQYFQNTMESQAYLNRQRGIGTGVAGLDSESRKKNCGGHQVAGCVRGRDTLWLGAPFE